MAATIFRLSTSFDNPALPIVAPLLRTNLVAAWRLYSGPASIQDLSGNGHTLKATGSPTWTDKGVIVDQNNYFESDVGDSLARTYVAVIRPILSSDGSESDSPGVGNHRRVDGEPYGLGIWNNGTASVQNLNMHTSGINSSGDFFASTNTFGGNRTRPSDGSQMEYAFAATAFDPVNNRSTGLAPRYGNATVIEWDTASPNYVLEDRPTLLPDGSENFVRIGSTPGVNGLDSQVEICEVLIFDAALTQAQIQQQYEYSKAFYYEVFNVEV